MSKTILFGSLFHETHSFLSQTTGMDDFRALALHLGEAIVTHNTGNGSTIDGFLELAGQKGWRVLPTIQMAAMPSGKVEDEVIAFFRARFFTDLARHIEEIDAIFLVLHGAMVSESLDDVEGALLEDIAAVLKQAGRSEVPVVAVLDLHANVSARMVDNSTLLRAYRENPHSDARDASIATGVLLDAIFTQPGVHQLHLPGRYVFPPTGVGSANAPMRAVLDAARAIEADDPDILCINVMAGYAYSDIADCGFSLNCTTRGDTDRAMAHLHALMTLVEAEHRAGYPKEDTLEEALAKADALPPGEGPILLIEAADNIGGGTPGDATGTLGPLLDTGRTGILAALADPDAVAQCREAGPGAVIEIEIGARTDAHHGAPLKFSGRVESLSDGRFTLENPHSHLASMQGTRIDMGPSAVIVNDEASILLSSRKTPPMDLGQFHSQGLYPEKARYVVVKAAVSHRDAYDPISRASFNIDSPGLCTSNLTRLPYRKVKGKIIALN